MVLSTVPQGYDEIQNLDIYFGHEIQEVKIEAQYQFHKIEGRNYSRFQIYHSESRLSSTTPAVPGGLS